MGEPFLGELRIFPYNFVPRGWAACDGQLLPINQNQALFSLLGTTYGGNGQTNFALPDLRGRIPTHASSSFPVGTRAGEDSHTVTVNELPMHVHALNATSSAADSVLPGGNLLANVGLNAYANPGTPQPLESTTLANVGGSQPHENRSPFLTLTIGIALVGVFPSAN